MNEKLKTVFFSIFITAFFTFMVSGVNSLLKARIDDNRNIAEQRVILQLSGLMPVDRIIHDNEILSMFAEKIIPVNFPDAPEFVCYTLKDNQGRLFTVPFKGQGFWDTISGFMAINIETMSIAGLAFTQHGETPGLGGRISEPEFMQRFSAKPINSLRTDGLRLKMVAEGTARKSDEIDGITGATGTTSAVEKIINNTISRFLNLSQRGANN